ncbi:hypothetical protein BU26DRAFT_499650 [Trematosphaeria pertusa]|uniref:Uncharacterized protein n=1 Tax=Trematosphaeria pertusa TaxID=390896 RepID=A0A6A6J6H6_9PLEO|nr:uncharacterized protein BU26DRAFT_499650 [Trematosphaeria pertusa]KAF2257093.1 hypothetical protein BU26DRAFT_499650 [Trematosphaeria pertusa]
MCQLQEVKYSCGHVRKTLLQACATAKRLGPTPRSRAPSYCVNGLEVIQGVKAEGSCGRGANGYTCYENQALAPLRQRIGAIERELARLSDRVANVHRVLESEIRPVYDWERVARTGYDVEEMKQRQVTLLTEILPERLAYWRAIVTHVSKQITAATNMTFKTLLEKIGSRVDNIPVSKLDLELWDEWISYDDNGDPIDIQPEFAVLEQVWERMHGLANEEAKMIEDVAATCCLEAIGWNPPQLEDEGERSLLYIALTSRIVHPVRETEAQATPL